MAIGLSLAKLMGLGRHRMSESWECASGPLSAHHMSSHGRAKPLIYDGVISHTPNVVVDRKCANMTTLMSFVVATIRVLVSRDVVGRRDAQRVFVARVARRLGFLIVETTQPVTLVHMVE